MNEEMLALIEWIKTLKRSSEMGPCTQTLMALVSPEGTNK